MRITRNPGSIGLILLVLFALVTTLQPVSAQTSGEPLPPAQRFALIFGDQSHTPDVAVAVGPHHIVTGANTRFSLTDKSGTILQTVLTNEFFGVRDLRLVGDPRCVYDPFDARFFCVSFYVDLGDLPTGLLLAVSKSSEPQSLGEQDWDVYELRLADTPGGELSAETDLRADFNAIAVTQNSVVLTTNMFHLSDETTDHTRVVVLDKRALLTESRIERDAEENILLDGHFSPTMPVVHLSESPVIYLAHVGGSSSHCTINLWWFDEAFALHRRDITGSFDCAETGRLAPQAETDLRLVYEGQNRTRPIFRDGKLYFVAATPAAGSGDGPTGLRWIVMDVSGGPEAARIEQTGYITVPDTWLYFAEIAVNEAGAIGLFFNASSESLRPAFCYTGRLSTDAANIMRPPVCPLVSPAPQTVEHEVGGNNARYGDYCGAAVDPSDDSLWGACEVIAPGGQWSIWAVQLKL